MDFLTTLKNVFTFTKERDKRINGLLDGLTQLTRTDQNWGPQHQNLADELGQEIQAARSERRIGFGFMILVSTVLLAGFVWSTWIRENVVVLTDENGQTVVVDRSNSDPRAILDKLGFNRDAILQTSRTQSERGRARWLIGPSARVVGIVEMTDRVGDLVRKVATPIGQPYALENEIGLFVRIDDYEKSDSVTVWNVEFGSIRPNSTQSDTSWTGPFPVPQTINGTPEKWVKVDHDDWPSFFVVAIGIGKGGASQEAGQFDQAYNLRAYARRFEF